MIELPGAQTTSFRLDHGPHQQITSDRKRAAHCGWLFDRVLKRRERGVQRVQDPHERRPARVAMSLLDLAEIARVRIGPLRELPLVQASTHPKNTQTTTERLLVTCGARACR
jgi:hypothetical protein